MRLNDLFDYFRLIAFPTQVTDLEVNFVTDPLVPTRVADGLRERDVHYGALVLAIHPAPVVL